MCNRVINTCAKRRKMYFKDMWKSVEHLTDCGISHKTPQQATHTTVFCQLSATYPRISISSMCATNDRQCRCPTSDTHIPAFDSFSSRSRWNCRWHRSMDAQPRQRPTYSPVHGPNRHLLICMHAPASKKKMQIIKLNKMGRGWG